MDADDTLQMQQMQNAGMVNSSSGTFVIGGGGGGSGGRYALGWSDPQIGRAHV